MPPTIMDDQDFDLRPDDGGRPPTLPPRGSQMAPRVLAAALVIAVLVTGYFVFRSPGDEAPAEDTAAGTATTPAERSPLDLGAEAAAVEVPPLGESDAFVRQFVSQLSSHPTVASWLATDDLIRSFTVAVTNIAEGQHPAAKNVRALRPSGDFQASASGEDVYLDPQSYARFTAIATAATSVDAAGAAQLYTTLKPRIEEAYRELGYPDTSFDQTLERAIVVLLQTPVREARPALRTAGAEGYAFADPTLEALQPAQKQLLRFGPDNQRAVQASIRRIAAALGIPPARLP
jgi:hypothetical protein